MEKYEELKGLNTLHRNILIVTLDQLWRNHLHTLDYIKRGVGLRAYAQKDPLNEYKFEAFRAFESMMDDLSIISTQRIFHVSRATPEEMAKMHRQRAMVEGRSFMRGPRLKPIEEITPRKAPEDRDPNKPESWGRVNRNEACPCGSGKKYKYCHGSIVKGI